MMAAVLAEGTTVLENAAKEPEITDLANVPRQTRRTHRRGRNGHDYD